MEKKSPNKDIPNYEDSSFYKQRHVSEALQTASDRTPTLTFSDLGDLVDIGENNIDNSVPTDEEIEAIIGKKF